MSDTLSSTSESAALEGVTRALEEKLATWKETTESITTPHKPTMQENVSAVMEGIRALEKKMGYQLQAHTSHAGHDQTDVVTSIVNVTVNEQGIQSAHNAPVLVVEADGVRLKTYGPGTQTVSDLMSVEEALEAVTPEKYREPRTEAAPLTALEKDTQAMLAGLETLQKALQAVGVKFKFNVVAQAQCRTEIRTNVVDAEKLVVRKGMSFSYANAFNNTRIFDSVATGSVEEILKDVGYKAARQFKLG